MKGILLSIGIIAIIFGLFFVYVYRRYKESLTHIKNTEMQTVSSISEEGKIELSGVVEVEEEEIESPFGNEKCVFSAWKIEEWNESGDTPSWETKAKGIETTDFRLDDGTDSVSVQINNTISEDKGFLKEKVKSGMDDEKGMRLEDTVLRFKDMENVLEHAPTEEPEYIEEFIKNLNRTGKSDGSITNKIDIGNEHGKRKYIEQNITEGDHMYILGEVEFGDDFGSHAGNAIVKKSDDNLTIISTKSEEELVNSLENKVEYYKKLATWCTGGGTLLLIILFVLL